MGALRTTMGEDVRTTVWKYLFPVNDEPVEVSVPDGARFVHVGPAVADYVLNPGWEEVVLGWAVVDLDAPRELRHFQVFGTGHHVPDGAAHVGTAQVPHGLVWHLFELKEPE